MILDTANLMKSILNGLLLILCLSFFSSSSAQWQEDEFDRRGKFYLVPEFWLSFGSSTYIEVAPLLGYHVTDRLSVGLGPHYIYQSQNANYMYPQSWSTHIYGGKAFSRFSIIRHAEEFLPINLFNELFVHLEYETISLEYAYYGTANDPDEGRFLFNSFLVGGGFTQRIGLNNAVTFMVLWNLNESYSSPYSNPLFRIGFNAYF